MQGWEYRPEWLIVTPVPLVTNVEERAGVLAAFDTWTPPPVPVQAAMPDTQINVEFHRPNSGEAKWEYKVAGTGVVRNPE